MALGIDTRNAITSLQKGRGVRQGKLTSLLFGKRSELGDLWRIARDDNSLVVLAKVVYRVEEVVGGLPDLDRTIARVGYNLLPDRRYYDLDLTQREALLAASNPDVRGFSPRDQSRVRKQVAERIERSLRGGPLPDVPDHPLAVIARREAEFSDWARGVGGHAHFTHVVGRVYASPVEEAAEVFLGTRVAVPRSSTGGLLVGRSATCGDWVCAFTFDDALRSHQEATRQPWSGVVRKLSGGELVEEVSSRWDSVGIVVNPAAVRGADASGTFLLPPEVLRGLVRVGPPSRIGATTIRPDRC